MKTIKKIILMFVLPLLFVSCAKEDEDFLPKDSYLYVWNVRTWTVDTESKLSDIKVTYFFKGDTARVKQINFWIIKENSTLYAEEAMAHQDRAYQLTEIQEDPDQKEYKNQCSFRFPDDIVTDYDGDPFVPGGEYRLVVKALGKDDMIVDSPTIESGIFTIYDPNSPESD